jgi:hypothetical protein
MKLGTSGGRPGAIDAGETAASAPLRDGGRDALHVTIYPAMLPRAVPATDGMRPGRGHDSFMTMPQPTVWFPDARVARRRNRCAACFAALLALLVAPRVDARDEEETPHVLGVTAGLGFSLPIDDTIDANGNGAFGEVEYIYQRLEWLTPRAYAGVVLTWPEDCGDNPCDVSSKIGFVGIKGRLLAPIPYLAPFIELGVGASLGSLTTRVATLVDVEESGLMYHIPFTLGLVLGKSREVELSFKYLFHPAQEQFNGAVALGFTFPLHLD